MKKFVLVLLLWLSLSPLAWARDPWYSLFDDYRTMNILVSLSDDSFNEMTFVVNRPSLILREGFVQHCFKDSLEILREGEFGPGNFQLSTEYRLFASAGTRIRYLVSFSGQGDSCRMRVAGFLQTQRGSFWVDDTSPTNRDYIRRLAALTILEAVYGSGADAVLEAYKNDQPLPAEPPWRK